MPPPSRVQYADCLEPVFTAIAVSGGDEVRRNHVPGFHLLQLSRVANFVCHCHGSHEAGYFIAVNGDRIGIGIFLDYPTVKSISALLRATGRADRYNN